MQTVLTLIDRLIDREGGFVDHPADRGGPTKYGITLRTLSKWRGYPCSREDVEAMPRSTPAVVLGYTQVQDHHRRGLRRA